MQHAWPLEKVNNQACGIVALSFLQACTHTLSFSIRLRDILVRDVCVCVFVLRCVMCLIPIVASSSHIAIPITKCRIVCLYDPVLIVSLCNAIQSQSM